MSDMKVDRATVRHTVEDFIQSQFLYHRNLIDTKPHLTPEQSQEETFQFSQRFFDRIEATAALMSPADGESFKKMVEEEYLYLSEECERNPELFLPKFGLSMGVPPQPVYRRQSIGEVAVRTAVRATVWELIFSLFRR